MVFTSTSLSSSPTVAATATDATIFNYRLQCDVAAARDKAIRLVRVVVDGARQSARPAALFQKLFRQSNPLVAPPSYTFFPAQHYTADTSYRHTYWLALLVSVKHTKAAFPLNANKLGGLMCMASPSLDESAPMIEIFL